MTSTDGVVGFHHEWSDELAKLPVTLADAQVARWQSKYGRDPTDQQRSWLVSKIRTDIAMMWIKLNARVMITNLQSMHEKSLPPTGARARMEQEYQDWARLQGRGPHTGGRSDRLLVGWRMW
jgi:hypothetical protein